MLLFALLAMLATSVAHAESEAQNQIAIGLPVLDRGVSLWLVRPKTMWGLEFDALESSWDELLFDHSVETDTSRRRYHIHSALTVKRQVSDSEGQVSKFAYLRVYAEHRETQLAEDILLWTDSGLEVGLGGLWRPWKKVSVLLRQGFAFEYSEKTQSAFPDRLREEDLDAETISLYMTKPRLLVLLHF